MLAQLQRWISCCDVHNLISCCDVHNLISCCDVHNLDRQTVRSVTTMTLTTMGLTLFNCQSHCCYRLFCLHVSQQLMNQITSHVSSRLLFKNVSFHVSLSEPLKCKRPPLSPTAVDSPYLPSPFWISTITKFQTQTTPLISPHIATQHSSQLDSSLPPENSQKPNVLKLRPKLRQRWLISELTFYCSFEIAGQLLQ